MKENHYVRPLLVAACLLVAFPLAARADSPTTPPPEHGMGGSGHEHGMPECPMHDGPPPRGTMAGHEMHGGSMFDAEEGVPPPLRNLHLTEAQQDKVFNILHAQAPQARELRKAIRSAHRSLHELATGEVYDDAKAKKLGEALGKAEADAALLHARVHHQILEVLTAEQRESLKRHADHADGEHDGWHRDEHGDGAPR